MPDPVGELDAPGPSHTGLRRPGSDHESEPLVGLTRRGPGLRPRDDVPVGKRSRPDRRVSAPTGQRVLRCERRRTGADAENLESIGEPEDAHVLEHGRCLARVPQQKPLKTTVSPTARRAPLIPAPPDTGPPR